MNTAAVALTFAGLVTFCGPRYDIVKMVADHKKWPIEKVQGGWCTTEAQKSKPIPCVGDEKECALQY